MTAPEPIADGGAPNNVLAANDSIYMVSTEGSLNGGTTDHLLALNPADLSARWQVDREVDPTWSTHIQLHAVFTDALLLSSVRSDQGKAVGEVLEELDSSTGKLVKSHTTPLNQFIVLVTPSTIYTIKVGPTGDDKSTIYSIDRQTDKERWSLSIHDPTNIAEEDGVVY
ncbi:MAG: hypothetical protein M3328_04090, partial [Chloroflexota bacterium]|nr:hypothetical protein [Chloroflexota bacterium]